MAVKIVVSGILGRMGRDIAGIVLDDEETELAGCVERSDHPNIGDDAGTLLGRGKIGISVTPSIGDVDIDERVIVDFTTPEATSELLNQITGSSARLVIGTTGLTDETTSLIKKVSKTNAVLYSPNMSLGVNLLFHLTKIVAEKTGDGFDIEIIEAHHRFKKDSPSGTAKRLGEIAAEARNRSYDKIVRHGRNGVSCQRGSEEIGIHAVRGGDIVGDHTVLFAGIGEQIELRHVAHSRRTLAQGAVIAAKWISARKQGLFSMSDVLGI